MKRKEIKKRKSNKARKKDKVEEYERTAERNKYRAKDDKIVRVRSKEGMVEAKRGGSVDNIKNE